MSSMRKRASLQLSRKAMASCCVLKRRPRSALTSVLSVLRKTAVTLYEASLTKLCISRSRSTIRRTATDCTRPAERAGLIFFQRMGDSSNPTMRSSTRRACCALTKSMLMSRGFSMALRMAVLVISWNTMRFVIAGSSFSTSNRCHEMASPSRSSSEASHTISAAFTAFFSSATSFSFSFGTSYRGLKLSLISILNAFCFRSRM